MITVNVFLNIRSYTVILYFTLLNQDIYEESRKVAGKMQALGVEPGDRFAFLCEPGIDFVSCLWACWYLR